jgi:hypothetical protein
LTGIIEDSAFLHIVISLGTLLFTASVFAEIFHRLKLPVVFDNTCWYNLGPFALDPLILSGGKIIVNLDETIKHIGELYVIVIWLKQG